jgi:hypothetical protein
MFFLQNKNITGNLGQYVDHPKWKFSKFRIWTSCGQFVEHLEDENRANLDHYELHCSSSLKPCRHAAGHLRGRPQPPLPRPGPWEVEGRRRTRPGPPPLCLTSPRTTPTTLPSPAPTHSMPQPRPKPPSTPPRPPCPAWPLHPARTPEPASFWIPTPPTLRPI